MGNMLLHERRTGLCVALLILSGCGGGGNGEPPPTPPRAIASSATLDEDTQVQANLSGSAGEGGSLTYSIRSQPANGTVTLTGASYTYTPDADFFGTDSFTFAVSESGRSSAPATVTLNVTGINDAPVAFDVSSSLSEDDILVAAVSVIDVDGDALTLAITGNPTNGAVTANNSITYTYMPAANFFGEDSFSYTVSDGVETTAERTITIDVTPVNDAPELTAAAVNVTAGSTPTIDMVGVDIENNSLTYRLSSDFGQVSVANDPTSSGLFDIDVPYGSFGADQATVVANDGIDDSAPVNIDLDIQVPTTTANITFDVFDGERSASAFAVGEADDGAIFVAGRVVGELANPTADFTLRTFISQHDESGLQTNVTTFDGPQLTNFAIGFDNSLFTAVAHEINDPLTIHTMSLDANGDASTDTSVTLPYAITRDRRDVETLHIEDVGFFGLSNDNRVHALSYAGALASTNTIASPLSELVHGYRIMDARVVGDSILVAGGLFTCTDDGSMCNGGVGTIGFVLEMALSGDPIRITALPGFPRDVAILEDGRVAAHVDASLYLVDLDGTVVWARTVPDTTLGGVGIDGGGDIYWWAFDSVSLNFVVTRVEVDNTLVWQTTSSYSLLGTLFFNGIHVDEYGNIFVSLIEQYNVNPNGFGRIVNVHVDYAGNHQWVALSEPSDMSANGEAPRGSSLLSSTYRLVTVATDGRDLDTTFTDGYVFFNAISPAPP